MKGIIQSCDLDGEVLHCENCDTIAKFNPFGLCLVVCDLHPESCEHCAEPFQCDQWRLFWERIGQEWAEQFKVIHLYGEPCDCGSSTCDECNPGWDQEPDDWEEPDYDF